MEPAMTHIDWGWVVGNTIPLLYLGAITTLGIAAAVHLIRNRRKP
jgi:hypothetical protein